jgi:hypothetical protein
VSPRYSDESSEQACCRSPQSFLIAVVVSLMIINMMIVMAMVIVAVSGPAHYDGNGFGFCGNQSDHA